MEAGEQRWLLGIQIVGRGVIRANKKQGDWGEKACNDIHLHAPRSR